MGSYYFAYEISTKSTAPWIRMWSESGLECYLLKLQILKMPLAWRAESFVVYQLAKGSRKFSPPPPTGLFFWAKIKNNGPIGHSEYVLVPVLECVSWDTLQKVYMICMQSAGTSHAWQSSISSSWGTGQLVTVVCLCFAARSWPYW